MPGNMVPHLILATVEEAGECRGVEALLKAPRLVIRPEIHGLGAGKGHGVDAEMSAPLEAAGEDLEVGLAGDAASPEFWVEDAGAEQYVH